MGNALQSGISALQNGGGRRLGQLHIRDGAAMLRRPRIRGKFSVYVRRGRDNSRRAERLCQPGGKGVRAADVAGQERNDKLRAFIQTNDGRVGLFIADIGRDLAHGDAAGADKDERVCPGKRRGVDLLFQRQKVRLLQPRDGIAARVRLRQGRKHAPGRSAARTTVSKDGKLHCVASRNSVVKPG